MLLCGVKAEAVSQERDTQPSEPPTLSLASPPPDALPSQSATQGEEGQTGGGRKILGFFFFFYL